MQLLLVSFSKLHSIPIWDYDRAGGNGGLEKEIESKMVSATKKTFA